MKTKKQKMPNDRQKTVNEILEKNTKLNLGKTAIEIDIKSYQHLNHHNINTNLYDKMHLKTFKKINEAVEKYPHTFSHVVTDLQHNINFLHVRYHTIYLLWAYGIIDSMFLSDLSKHFDL